MKKGDKCKIYRGPLAGMIVELLRHDKTNRAWHCKVAPPDNPAQVLVYDYELAETIERKPRAIKKK